MYFDMEKLLGSLEEVKSCRILNQNKENWKKMDLTAVLGIEGEWEELRAGYFYVVSAEGWTGRFESADCAGVVIVGHGGKDGEDWPEEAFSGRFPVAKAEADCSPGQLAEALSNAIIRESQKAYDDFVDTSRYLFSNTLNKQDVKALMEYFKGMIGNPVAVFDAMFHCLLTTDDFLMELEQPRTFPKKVYMKTKYLNRHFVRQRVGITVEGVRREYPMISFPISFQNRIRAYLSIPAVFGEVKNLDSPEIEITASAIMGQLKHNLALQMAEERNVDGFFYNLIYRKDMDGRELQRQARFLRIKREGRFVTVILKALCSGSAVNMPSGLNGMFRYSQEDKLFLIISTKAKEMKMPALVGRLDGRFVILCEMNIGEEEGLEEIKNCCRKIQAELKENFLKSSLQAGIGSVTEGIDGIKESYHNGEKALSYGSLMGGDRDFVIPYQDTFLLRLIGSIQDKKELEGLIPCGLFVLEKYDREHNADLVNTLSVYFEYNCNMKKSAQAMPVHYKTMVYRINQISELCHTDFSDSDSRMQYGLGIKIFRLLRNK